MSSDRIDKLLFSDRIDKLYDGQIKVKSDRLMEDHKIPQFIQALKFFDLELKEITGQPGYEDRNGKVIAIRKKDNARILCAYSSYDELLEWAKQQFNY